MGEGVGDCIGGRWIGRYDYARGLGAPVAFEAVLDDASGRLSGRTTEPNGFAPGAGDELTATLDGWTDDGALGFTKVYDTVAQGDHPVYEGRLDAAGVRISGTWRFPSWPWIAGTFVMVRRPELAAARTARRRATMPAGG